MNFKDELLKELTGDILPYWESRMVDPAGGFHGRRDGTDRLVPGAPKGLILNARILWTFSAAARVLGAKGCRDTAKTCILTAKRARDYILEHFIDRQYGGAYWSLGADGTPLDTKKQFYAIAFAIYGLAEYHRATGDAEALEEAIALYRCIEEHSLDPVRGGYIEACSRDWQPLEDMRLSAKDRNDAKTMNTHLHILEGYTALLRVWLDDGLRKSLTALIDVFTAHIIGPDGHLRLFFDEDWRQQDSLRSFGHDIEASWLLAEAAGLIGGEPLVGDVTATCRKVAQAAMEGFSPDRGMIYEYDPATGRRDADRHWWVQAETVVGCYDQWQRGCGPQWLEASEAAWRFIKGNLLCPGGEWYWSVRADGTPNTDDDRAGFWKCPYHNSRMCLELIARGA